MKILFVTPQRPEPPKKGTTLRNYYLIREAARHHGVRVLAIRAGDDVAPAPNDDPPPLPVPVDLVPMPERPKLKRLSDLLTSNQPDLALRLRSQEAAATFVDLLRAFRPDAVQFEAVEAAGAVGPLGSAFRQAGVRPAIIYDAHNAEYSLQHTIWRADLRRPRRWPLAAYSIIQWRRLLRYERALCRASRAVIAVSPADAALLTVPGGPVPVVVPNGVDTGYYRFAPRRAETPPLLVFVGTLDFRPNVDALRWFVAEVMPLLRLQIATRFAIVGRSPSPAVQALAADDVQVIGPVPDERPWLERASVYVVPLRMGGGMRFKVVQAMAAGVPVVSTRFGAEGVEAEDGEHLLLADEPAELAAAIVRTLTNPAEAQQRAERSRSLAEQRYDWRAILPALTAIYDRLDAAVPV